MDSYVIPLYTVAYPVGTIVKKVITEICKSVPGLENREYGRRDPLRWPRDTLLSAKVGTNFVDKRLSLEFVLGLRPRSLFILFM
jgi:hypothetical protein